MNKLVFNCLNIELIMLLNFNCPLITPFIPLTFHFLNNKQTYYIFTFTHSHLEGHVMIIHHHS
ncbi:hypothetical protein HanXRQr2_Chr10g0451251 [Helianthus annuus]|uniref:Uncharacterized protein n=1 Tax=Helianthus annuus TaxID=4232 RepID=A0A9K3HZS7_HELAN|nr:hypothetical protein HanXRQr2_Chr10g0451251 [Helianthus annuus]